MNTDTTGSVTGLLASGLDPLKFLWLAFIQYLPQILGAIIIIIVGWFVASIVGTIVKRAVKFTGVDAWVEKSGLNARLKLDTRSRYALVSSMVGTIVKWVLLLGTIGIASETLHLTQVSIFLGTILAFIPNVVVAILILTIGMIVSQFVYDLLAVGMDAAHLPVGNRTALATIAKYAIIVFSFMAALTQLQIVPQLIQIAFAGMVFSLSLAFGLGGKDHASDWIQKMRNQAK